jgi:hypothetical protein
MLRCAVIMVGTATVVPVLLGAGQAPHGSGPCAVVDGTGSCLIEAADPGRPGGPTGPPVSPRRSPTRTTPARPLTPAEIFTSGQARGLSPAALGPLVAAAPVAAGAAAGANGGGVGGPAAAPAPAAAVLAQRAVELLALRSPAVRTSAQGSAYVGVPLWLWIDQNRANVGPVSATAVAGAAHVTATARLVATRWSMGPAGAAVTCTGPGTPWTGQAGASPDCGYTYGERSLPARTAGSGAWTVRVTGVWRITWDGVTGGAAVAGVQEIDLVTPQPLPVGELQVLVTGDGR